MESSGFVVISANSLAFAITGKLLRAGAVCTPVLYRNSGCRQKPARFVAMLWLLVADFDFSLAHVFIESFDTRWVHRGLLVVFQDGLPDFGSAHFR